LAREGIRFDRHVSQSSWTKASMASLWTALNPSRTGVHRYMHAVPKEALMPAEIFRQAGFRTEGIWRNGWVAPNFGFGQGFETYARPMPGPLPAQIRHDHPGASLPGSDLDATRAALEFLRTVRKEDRFLLYVHLMDIHQYTSDMESAIFGTTYSDLYDNAIHWTDRNIARLLEDLRARGLRERTLVVIAADHGEAFKEHEFEGHARNLYGEVIETPWIISLPFRLEEPLVVDSPSANIDIWPTLLDLLGLPALGDVDGHSLVAAIDSAARGRVVDPDRPIMSELDTGWGSPRKRSNRTRTLTQGKYRAHELNEEGFELYDLETDPGELDELGDREPSIREAYRAELDAYAQEAEPPWTTDEVELDELMLNQLRALGYKIE
jgi:arylsulfatase A-like enzyme